MKAPVGGKPSTVVEIDYVDDQRIPFPVANRISHIGGIQIGAMRPDRWSEITR